MKKFLSLFLCGILMLGLFAGCGSKINKEQVEEDFDVNIDMTDDDYNQTATLSIGVTADPFFTELINSVKTSFAQIFPNVKIEIMRISGTDYASAVIARKQAGNMPDIFFSSETEAFRFISSGLFLNLDPYIEAETAANPEWNDQFVEEAMKLGKEKYSGKQRILPISSDRIVVHMNMSYVKAALNWDGRPDKTVTMDLIKNGWSWEDFVRVSEAIRAYFDYRGWTKDAGRFIVDPSLTWSPVTFSLFKSNGVEFYKNGEWKLDSEETKNTIKMIRELVDKGIVAPTDGGAANFENGSGAMFIHSSSAISKYRKFIEGVKDTYDLDNNPETTNCEYDIVTFPTINGDNGVTGYGIPGYGISSDIDPEKRDLAWQFLSFLISEEGQNAVALAGMHTPSVRKDLQDYNTAAWGEGFRDINMGATTFEQERNYSETFFLNFEAQTQPSILSACGNFVSNIMKYSNNQPAFSEKACIDNAIKSLRKASIVK